MREMPLQVEPSSLAKAAVSMDMVADEVARLESLVTSCRLPSLAFGLVGEPACASYNNRDWSGASDKVTALRGEAADVLATGLGRNALGYVAAEYANLAGIEKAAGSGHNTLTGLTTGETDFSWFTVGRAASYYTLKRRVAGVAAEADRSVDAGLDAALQKAAAARVSMLAELSQRIETTLGASSAFSIGSAAALVFWIANAVVASDDVIDTAIGSWQGISAGARTIFGEWMPAIGGALFRGWTGPASTQAQQQFASFVADGKAFADEAGRMASKLTTIVQRLNTMYWGLAVFTGVQVGIMIVLAGMALINPEAAVLLQRFGLALRASVTIAVNMIEGLLGGLAAYAAA